MPPKQASSVLILSLVFLAVFSHAQAPVPVTQQQLLSWVIGGMTEEHLLQALHQRGLQSISDALIDAANSAGASDAVMINVRKSKAPKAEDNSASFIALTKAAKSLQGKNDESAFKHLQEALTPDKNDADVLFAVAGLFRRLEAWPQAAAAYRAVTELAPDFPDGWQGRSYVHYRMEDSEHAIEFAKMAIKLDPNDSDSHKFLGLAFGAAEDQNSALREFGEALRLDPNNAAAYYDRGIVLTQAGRYDGAISDYRKAVSLRPQEYTYWYNMGITYGKKDDFDNAISSYKRAKSLRPDALEVRQNLGAAYCTSQRHAEAITEFRELLKLEPTWNMARSCLAKSLAATNDMKGALQAAKDYLRYDPDDQEMQQYVAVWSSSAAAAPTPPASSSPGSTSAFVESPPNAFQEWRNALQAAMETMNRQSYPEAEIAFNKAIALARKVVPDSGQVSETLQQYSGLYVRQSRFADAEAILHRAVDAARKSGNQSQTEAGALDSLGMVCLMEKKYNDAVQAYLDELTIANATRGPRDPMVGMVMDHLAGAYSSAGRFDDAEPLLSKYLSATEEFFGKDDFNVYVPLDHLGALYSMEKKFDKAEVTYRRALSIAEKKFGVNSPMLNGPLSSLADSLRQLGRSQEADAFDARRASLSK